MPVKRSSQRHSRPETIQHDGLEGSVAVHDDKDTLSRLRAELALLYGSRAKDASYARVQLQRMRQMTDALKLYADPDSPVYRLPNPAAYAQYILTELEILLPPPKQPLAEPEARGHKGVAGIMADNELEVLDESTE